MMNQMATMSTRFKARITGGVYLLYFLTAVLGKLITDRGLVVYGSAVSLSSTAAYIAVTLLFYYLFRPVNKSLALLAALLSLLGCANDLLSLFHLAPVQVNSLAFFGPFDILIGYLILRSTFLPRILGGLMVLAGLGWLIFLALPPANGLVAYIEVLGFVAEAALMLWLLVMGVNDQRWEAQATPAGKAEHRVPERANI